MGTEFRANVRPAAQSRAPEGQDSRINRFRARAPLAPLVGFSVYVVSAVAGLVLYAGKPCTDKTFAELAKNHPPAAVLSVTALSGLVLPFVGISKQPGTESKSNGKTSN